MIDTEVRGSPGWWLEILARELHQRRFSPSWSSTSLKRDKLRPSLELLDDYLRGDPPLPHAAESWKEGVLELIRQARMNYALMCVQSVQHRLRPVGFGTAAEDDRDGDQLATDIFKANALDLRFTETIEDMLGMGDGYMIVGPGEEGGLPVITDEDPRQVITAEDPRTGRTIAALKLFRDDWDDTDFAYLYLPGRVHVARKAGGRSTIRAGAFRMGARAWEWDEDKGGVDGQALPELLKAEVPVVRFKNARGVADFEPHLNVLDRINDQILQRMSIAKHQAYRQRGIKGLPERDPVTQEEIDYSDAFLASPGGMWQMPKEAEVWESSAVDLTPIRMATKDDVEGFAAATGTPLHYITPDAAQGSAEGASAMREAHLFRVDDRGRRVQHGGAKVMGLAFAWRGDAKRSNPLRIRTLWGPAERYSLQERMTSAVSAKAGGLPQASIYTDVMGYAPSDVPRLEAERGKDLVFLAMAEPAPATSGGGGDGGDGAPAA